jgi:hypothetical protein
MWRSGSQGESAMSVRTITLAALATLALSETAFAGTSLSHVTMVTPIIGKTPINTPDYPHGADPIDPTRAHTNSSR